MRFYTTYKLHRTDSKLHSDHHELLKCTTSIPNLTELPESHKITRIPLRMLSGNTV